MSNQIELVYTEPQVEIFFNSPEKFVIVTKGRRFGATKGAAHAFIEYCIDGVSPLLWVDTINSNIDRYIERYFYPVLKQLPSDKWSWHGQKKILKIYDSVIDFRSAENPESIEGFGYKKIFLNEAGIILEDDYLYTNAILPMLMDYSDSQLIAAGVPKGKEKKNGQKHKFFELFERAQKGMEGYKSLCYTSFDNPFLTEEDIKEIENELSTDEADQEIYGKFIDYGGSSPFMFDYDPVHHENTTIKIDTNNQLFISLDFNLTPFAVTFWNIFRDHLGLHVWCVDELEIKTGSVPAMAEEIYDRYRILLGQATITGDYNGNKGELSQADNASLFTQLLRGLKVSDRQLKIVPNPFHKNSRADCNYLLRMSKVKGSGLDFRINPNTCPNTSRDMKNVQYDQLQSKIVKRNRKDINQQGDFHDTVRYAINTFVKPFLTQHQKNNR